MNDTKNYPNECPAVELSPNEVLINARGFCKWAACTLLMHAIPHACACCMVTLAVFSRMGSVSTDGGLSFSAPHPLEGLIQPFNGCEGSTVREPTTGDALMHRRRAASYTS